MDEHNVDYYMAMPYTRVLQRDKDGDVIARIDELPGCLAHGEHDAEALNNLEDIQRAWIEARIASNLRVPEPREDALPSGKWVQRVPRSLHRQLTALAQREGVSLNHLATVVLSMATEILRVGGLQVFSKQRDLSREDCWAVVTDEVGFELKGSTGGSLPGLPMALATFHRLMPNEGRIDNEEDEKAHQLGR